MNTTEAFLRIEKELEQIRALLIEQADEILDIQGLQNLTGLSRSAVYQKTCSQNGEPPELPHYRKGKRLFFRRSEIERWLTAKPIRSRHEIDTEAATLAAKRRIGS